MLEGSSDFSGGPLIFLCGCSDRQMYRMILDKNYRIIRNYVAGGLKAQKHIA